MPVHNSNVRLKDHFLQEMFIPASRNDIDVLHVLKEVYGTDITMVYKNNAVYIGNDSSVVLTYCIQRVRNRAEVVGKEEIDIIDPDTNEPKTVITSSRKLRQKGGNYIRIYAFDAKSIKELTQGRNGFSIVIDDEEFKKFAESMKGAENAPPVQFTDPTDPEIQNRMTKIVMNSAELIHTDPEIEEERDPD